MIRIAIIGDFDAGFPPHPATDRAIGHAAAKLGVAVDARWLATDQVIQEHRDVLSGFDGLWIAPGSPYRSIDGALIAIEHARLGGIPLIGTCGGCQHVILEYARHVLGFTDAQHAEYDPYASLLFIVPLSCSLVGKTMNVRLAPGSNAARLYGSPDAEEQYYCNFGLDPRFEPTLESGGLRISGRDANGEARILELRSHPFFCATVFVPQLTSVAERPHPLITGFLECCVVRARKRS